AYTATTHAELAMLVQDLPGAGAAPAPPAAPPAGPVGRKRRWFVGIMGDSKRRGKWRIDQELGAVAVMGDVLLDLREAEVRTDSVDITAVAVMGDVKIIVPDGVNVDLEGVAVMGDKKVNVLEAAPGMNVPVVRVRAYAVMGDVKVVGDSRAQPLKRGFAAWREHWRQIHGEDWRDLGRQIRADSRELHKQLRDQHRGLAREIRRQNRDLFRGH
ncbi:MAG TPA: LiaF domain-containing protein, partial [Nonomuraea sp.]|nr:LiaF domain-containing protein [Nonomuraea sp.]